jgi:hypothetical protein
MVNYGKGKIYKIQKIGGNSEIYIGSTTKDYLSQRMDKHRSNYKCWKRDGKRFVNAFRLFDLYGVENCEIVLLESINCNTKDELRAREGFYIQNNICVNKLIAGRSIKESNKHYYETNKIKYLEQVKEYRNSNKEVIKEKKKLYAEKNKEKIRLKKAETFICECGCETTKVHKNRHVKTAKHIKAMEALNTNNPIA